MRPLVHLLQTWWMRRDLATRELPPHLWQAVRNYLRYGTRQAAALAYYAIFSVFPLTLLLAVAIGGLVGPAVAQEQIINGLGLFLPEATLDEIRQILEGAISQSSSFGLVAAVALLWSSTALFTNITLALDNIFQVPSARSMWRQRLLALGMGIALVVLVGASFLTSGVLRLLSALLLDRPNIWVLSGTVFVPLGLDLVIFALLFRYVPARHVYWDSVWPAALFGAIGWELAKTGFEWFIANLAQFSVVYGGLATGIVLLFWAYLIASIFLFSAELCARLNEWQSLQKSRENKRRQIQLRFQHEPATLPPPPPNDTPP